MNQQRNPRNQYSHHNYNNRNNYEQVQRNQQVQHRQNVNHSKAKSKTRSRVIAIILAAVLAVVTLFLVWFVFYKPDSSKNQDVKFTLETDENGNQVSLISDDSSYNFLICGHDKAANLTDVIMLVNYNLKNQSISIMQLPRDTYMTVDDYYYHKLNGLYGYYYNQAEENNSSNPEKDGIIKTAEYLEKNLAIKIHYSAVMDLDGFKNIVDAIGGVDMYVPQDMYYTDANQGLYINLQEGYQHLDGDKAEQLVRFRKGYLTGDIGRVNAQKLFISAFIDKLKSSLTDVSKITSIINNMIKYVDTDITAQDLVYFAKAFAGISTSESVKMENVKMFTMPGNGVMYDYASFYVLNKESAVDLINEYFNIYDYDIVNSFDKEKAFVTYEDYTEVGDIYYADKENFAQTIYSASSVDEELDLY